MTSDELQSTIISEALRFFLSLYTASFVFTPSLRCFRDFQFQVRRYLLNPSTLKSVFLCVTKSRKASDTATIVSHRGTSRRSSILVSGVCKIQKGDITSMTEDEKEACSHLRANAGDVEAQATLNVREKSERRRRNKRSSSCLEGYFENVNYIIGSAAEMERLWSIAQYVLTT
jgi:hypothetical protein